VIIYRFRNKLIKSVFFNCHFYDEIENSNNIILQYKSGAKIFTLWISLQRYNDKFGFLLSIFAALGGVPCSMKYSFCENEYICW